jgi:hypothetical protein
VREGFREEPGDLVKLVDIWRYFDKKLVLFSESRVVLEGPCGVSGVSGDHLPPFFLV